MLGCSCRPEPAVVDVQDYRGMTPPLHLHNSDNTEIIKLLLQGNTIINARDHDGRTTLSRAVEVGKEPMVQLLLQHSGTRVNLQDKNGVTPLHLAPCTLPLCLNALSWLKC